MRIIITFPDLEVTAAQDIAHAVKIAVVDMAKALGLPAPTVQLETQEFTEARSARTGEFVDEQFAQQHPRTTEEETISRGEVVE